MAGSKNPPVLAVGSVKDEKLQDLSSWDADFGMDETEFEELYGEGNWDMVKNFVQ